VQWRGSLNLDLFWAGGPGHAGFLPPLRSNGLTEGSVVRVRRLRVFRAGKTDGIQIGKFSRFECTVS
jgi:hypothetical protein